MRAENGMEDLIFVGTQTRPPRNSAEVVVTLDNAARIAPAEFNSADTLEVSRRMERGDGSAYRINGKPALARDVQVLFKDAGFEQSRRPSSARARWRRSSTRSHPNAAPSSARQPERPDLPRDGMRPTCALRGTEQNLERAEALEKGLSDQLGSLRKLARLELHGGAR